MKTQITKSNDLHEFTELLLNAIDLSLSKLCIREKLIEEASTWLEMDENVLAFKIEENNPNDNDGYYIVHIISNSKTTIYYLGKYLGGL